MTLRDRLADPWGLLLAATAGGLAWAVLPGAALAVPIGVGVAAAVYGVKVAADALVGGRGHPSPSALAPTALPEPRRGTPARTLLDRAERALRALDETVESAAASATREQLRAVRDEAAGTRAGIPRLAGQAAAFSEAMDRIPANRLATERKRLATLLRRTRHGAVAAEHRAALAGVEQQLAAPTRGSPRPARSRSPGCRAPPWASRASAPGRSSCSRWPRAATTCPRTGASTSWPPSSMRCG